jgi:hypothetical protein
VKPPGRLLGDTNAIMPTRSAQESTIQPPPDLVIYARPIVNGPKAAFRCESHSGTWIRGGWHSAAARVTLLPCRSGLRELDATLQTSHFTPFLL